ncbi:MAG: protein kinase domain-containing protein, partial [Acidimicrobiales bacterium]
MTVRPFRGASAAIWSYDDSQLLGPGGFGNVYAGSNEGGVAFAVKVLPLDPSRARPLESLLREVEIAERINAVDHPHLLPAIDHAVESSVLYLVMPLASESLDDALRRGLTAEEQLVAMKDVAQGLMQLHGLPILHRDLKPKNVLSRNDVWALADFGIARDLDESTATLTWAGFGTTRYMAPE